MQAPGQVQRLALHCTEDVCVHLQRATLAALRCFYVARSYLATSKAVEAMGLFQRTSDRISQAEQAWDDLEHPDVQALEDLQALNEQAVVRPLKLQIVQNSSSTLHVAGE